MTGATTQGGTLQLVATATGSTLAALDQHQMGTDTERGQSLSLGTCRLALVAGYQEQDWSANCGAGFKKLTLCFGRGRRGSGPFSRIPHRLDSSPSRRPVRCPSRCISHHLRVRAHVAAPLVFHSVRSAGCTRPRAQSLAHKQVIQAVAYGPHLSRLSSSLVSAGFNNASTRGQSVVHLTQKRGA